MGAVLFNQYGELLRIGLLRYYDENGKQVDFGTNRYFELTGKWYYAGNDEVLKGPQTIDGVKVYSIKVVFKLRAILLKIDTNAIMIKILVL